MSGSIFEGAAHLKFEGEFVLELQGIYGEHVAYQVIGARHLPVTIYDYRRSGVDALHFGRQTGDLSRFTAAFKSVAHIKLSKGGDDNCLLIELFDPPLAMATAAAPYTLWVAAGFEGKLPLNRYLYYYAEPMDDGRCVLIALFARVSKATMAYLSAPRQTATAGASSPK